MLMSPILPLNQRSPRAQKRPFCLSLDGKAHRTKQRPTSTDFVRYPYVRLWQMDTAQPLPRPRPGLGPGPSGARLHLKVAVCAGDRASVRELRVVGTTKHSQVTS
jgi:hypothetical protein